MDGNLSRRITGLGLSTKAPVYPCQWSCRDYGGRWGGVHVLVVRGRGLPRIKSNPISLHGKYVHDHPLKCSNCNSELCNLKFYPQVGELEDVFGHITVQEEEEQVAQNQAEEDLRLYGTRIEPADAVHVDEDVQLTKLPPKRSALEFDAGADRPTKVRKNSKSRTFNFDNIDAFDWNAGELPMMASTFDYENITAMDWNAGESPMMAWVNQSAVPAVVPPDTSSANSPFNEEEKLLQQEEKEIEIFKNVYISDTSVLPATKNKFAASIEAGSDLDFGAKIYYRNIIDRYPLLPPYLARRLAVANHSRAERLQQSRHRNETKRNITVGLVNEPLWQARPISPLIHNDIDQCSSIPKKMPEIGATTDWRPRRVLQAKDKRLICEYHEKFPSMKQTELAGKFFWTLKFKHC